MIASSSGTLGGHLKLGPGEMYALNVRFVSNNYAKIGARVFNLDILQLNGKEIMGGVRFSLRTHAASRYECQNLVADHLPGPRDGGNWIGKTLTCCCGCGCSR